MPVAPVLVIQHEADDPPGRLGAWLIDAGLELDVRAPYAGDELPADLSGHSALLVLGGAVGANDDLVAPWLSATRTLLALAVQVELPAWGICLGAQLLAVATGGRVERGKDGPELGPQLIAKRAAAATDPLLGPMPITPDILQWHYDAIVSLPPSAVLLASSPVYEVQAFRLGRLAWGIQGHIETTPELVRAWADNDPLVQDYDLSRLLARSDALHDDIEQVWRPVAQRFADVVRDPCSIRAARGPAMTMTQPVTDPAAIRAALAQEMQSSRMPIQLGRRSESDINADSSPQRLIDDD
jgi:GMP synthase (glutamine-hydrolysing)